MANISKINFKGVEYDIKPLMDAEPTTGSTNAVQSGGVKSALDGIQAEIPTVDSVPTQGSSNAVSSGGVWSAFAERSAITCTVDTSGNATLQLGEEDLTEIAELIGGTA